MGCHPRDTIIVTTVGLWLRPLCRFNDGRIVLDTASRSMPDVMIFLDKFRREKAFHILIYSVTWSGRNLEFCNVRLAVAKRNALMHIIYRVNKFGTKRIYYEMGEY